MKMIVGLGNPGGKYQETRHNVGFMVVDKLVKNKLPVFPSLKTWKDDLRFKAKVSKVGDIIFLKPETYMNLSGEAVRMARDYYKIMTEDIWVIHDDIDLPLGKLRIRRGGASAGHNGIESIIKSLNSSDFIRFRLGIGKGKNDQKRSMDRNIKRQNVVKFVVSRFRDNEAGDLKKLIKRSVEAIEVCVKEGLEKTMNRYN